MKRRFEWFSLAAALLLAIGGAASAQVTLPSKAGRVGTPGRLELPRSAAQLTIFGVSHPSVNPRANTPFDATITVSVRNTGQTTGIYWLAATLRPGSIDEPRSGPFEVRPGSTSRTPFRLHANMADTFIQGEQLPIVVRLLDNAGREVHRFSLNVPFLPAARNATLRRGIEQSNVILSPGPTPNLSLDWAAVGWTMTRTRGQRIGTRDGRAVSEIALANLAFSASVTNTYSAPWGYQAAVHVSLSEGTPQTGLRSLSGLSGCVMNVPGNQASLTRRNLRCVIEPAGVIRPGIWYTAQVYLQSTADSDRADNYRRVVFMYGYDGRLASQSDERLPAPNVTALAVRR